jgi:hypothetical protein
MERAEVSGIPSRPVEPGATHGLLQLRFALEPLIGFSRHSCAE